LITTKNYEKKIQKGIAKKARISPTGCGGRLLWWKLGEICIQSHCK